MSDDSLQLEARAAAALERARDRGIKILLAWTLAAAGVAAVIASFPSLLGWPSIKYEVEGRVTYVVPGPDGEIVTYEAEGPEGTIVWGRHFEDSEWDVGDSIEGWVVEGDRFHQKTGTWWMGATGFLLWFMTVLVLGYSARRVAAILIALWDVRRGRDRPQRGYVALVDNPVPRSVRPLALIWRNDPIDGQVAPHDRVLLVDEDIGSELESPGPTRIYEALIDTGRFEWMKPRWIAVGDSVIVPHRHALLAALMLTPYLRKQRARGPVPLDTEVTKDRGPIADPDKRSNFARMLAWRLAALVALAVLSNLATGPGDAIEIVRPA